jgi:hypothetical protein
VLFKDALAREQAIPVIVYQQYVKCYGHCDGQFFHGTPERNSTQVLCQRVCNNLKIREIQRLTSVAAMLL